MEKTTMAKNNSSFNSFGSFSRLMNNPKQLADAFNTDTLTATLNGEHQSYLDSIKAYEAWANSTLLGDVISPKTGRKFSELFAIEKGDYDQQVVVFNPTATNGTNWSKNVGGMVNSLLHSFGTLRYSVLEHGLHERIYDASKVIEHNVRSAYDTTTQRWMRFDWKNRRFVQNTPYWKSAEGAGWMSKHSAVDEMLLALAGDQSIRYNFFVRAQVGNGEISWNRFQLNVLGNLNTLVATVNNQMANQAEVSQTVRVMDNQAQNNPVAVGAMMVDGVDLKSLKGIVRLEIKMAYGSNAVVRPVNVENAQVMANIAAILADPKTETVHIVK
jgi:hypothetical protein